MGLSVLICFVVYHVSTLYPAAQHFTALTQCHQTVAAKSLSLWSRDHSGQCWSLLIRQCVVNCMLHGCGCVLAPAPAPSEQNMTASEEPHSPATRPRTAALAAAERNPVRGFPVKLLLCRLPARARNKPSRESHNYGEGPYKGLSWLKGPTSTYSGLMTI